ncbi:PaaI family thioesterase [Gordonia sp. TBRC 11910]|uniref:PaaI family thioesterase n=1 Tax=Gordonia asplenii TaxID=2725283 RepID=A0A848KZ18_9ACTN|nr:acyl-CoA thioesterase domain-containing protein [Gordonia asplenii]NMO03950.1 PaaI family thioesterase [Gordonia asplenii]
MAQTIQFVAGGADALMRVTPTSLDDQRAVFSIPTGPWLTDPHLGRVRSALGIPLDDVTGYVVAAGVPPGRWPVSLGIKVDFLADAPVDGTSVTLVGELVARTDVGATTRGIAYSETGDMLALVTHRSHLIHVVGRPQTAAFDGPVPDAEAPLRESLAFTTVERGVVMAPTPWTANVMGNVHGGVLVVGSELAAHSMVGEGFSTVSIDVSFLRPCDATAPTVFRGDVVHQGRTVAVVHVAAIGHGGRTCAVATVILQRPAANNGDDEHR